MRIRLLRFGRNDTMRIFKKTRLLQEEIARLKNRGKTIGFVPTMGSLHEGHLSLVRRAKKECGAVCVSIFVNPLQFGPKEDFKKYPRDEKRDRAFLKREKTDFLFMPPRNEMVAKDFSAYVEVGGELPKILEGKFRPGHFKGVATIVMKLFHAVNPDRAYFGMKDYQQLKIIEKMTRDFNMHVRIVPCETVREKDGLALSSRNAYLSLEERMRAAAVSRVLKEIKKDILRGQKNAGYLKRKALHSLASVMDTVDYVELRDARMLKPLKTVRGKIVVLAAARLGKTRLIDNVVVDGV